MQTFTVGQTVQITGTTMTGNVGTVVYEDQERELYLVRIDAVTQNYFSASDLELFSA